MRTRRGFEMPPEASTRVHECVRHRVTKAPQRSKELSRRNTKGCGALPCGCMPRVPRVEGRSAEETRLAIEAFLKNSRQPALLEPGEELLAFGSDNFSLGSSSAGCREFL